jgi:cellobiose transport system substrate-binding protein
MKIWTKVGSAAAIVVAASTMLAGCSNGGTTTDSGDKDGKITITIGTFNNFGYEKSTDAAPGADLYNKYMEENPNITIKSTVAATSDDARATFNTAIGAGTGAYDIQAVDVDWMPDIMANPDKYVDLKGTVYTEPNDWLDWKTEIATTDDGKILGAGTDIGPEGICFRTDLLKQMGINNRDEFAKHFQDLGGDWDAYFAMGKEYVEATGNPWFDSAAAIDQGIVSQIKYSYVDKDGNIIAATNPVIKDMYDKLTKAAVDDKESAGLAQWSDTFNKSFNTTGAQSFATTLCPAWFINNIKGNTGADYVGWDIADVFPAPNADEAQYYDGYTAGAGDWGGSYLVVPNQGANASDPAHLKAVEDFVKWLTAPEQQTAVFTAASNYPSSPTSEADPAVAGKVDAYLNNAPVGQIFANRAKDVQVPFKGDAYFTIQTAMANALNRVDAGVNADGSQGNRMPAADSWTQFLTDAQSAAD